MAIYRQIGGGQMTTKLQTYRESLGLSQTALAERAGCGQQMISRLESGERQMTRKWAERLAPCLGVSVVTLLDLPMVLPVARDLPQKVLECRLLDFWRKLSPEQQNIALLMIDSWAASFNQRDPPAHRDRSA